MVVARTQTLVQLSDELVIALDQVAASTGASRSELIRRAIAAYLADELAASDDQRIVDGYTRIPHEVDAFTTALAVASIAQEPW